MKNLAITFITIVAVSNALALTASACGGGGGGYRGSISIQPSFRSAPIYRPSSIYRPVATQPSIRRVQVQRVQQQPQIRLAPTQRRQGQASQPIANTAPATTSPVRLRAQQQATQQPAQQAAPRQVASNPAPAPTGNNSGVRSALAALARQEANVASAGGQPTAGDASTPQHIGTWTAKVGDNATIKLNLEADGSFNWVADNGGKLSQFDGTFTLENGTLTLARSSDNQKLAGSLSFSSNGFNFKLNGAKDAGLSFSQS